MSIGGNGLPRPQGGFGILTDVTEARSDRLSSAHQRNTVFTFSPLPFTNAKGSHRRDVDSRWLSRVVGFVLRVCAAMDAFLATMAAQKRSANQRWASPSAWLKPILLLDSRSAGLSAAQHHLSPPPHTTHTPLPTFATVAPDYHLSYLSLVLHRPSRKPPATLPRARCRSAQLPTTAGHGGHGGCH